MFFSRRTPVILQSEGSECGLANIAMICAHWGREFDLPALRRRFPTSLQGSTLSDLSRIARALDFTPRVLKSDLSGLKEVRLPAIIHWEFNHFVVLASISGDRFTIHDPAIGRRRLKLAELSRSFTGVVLELRPNPGFSREKEKARLGYRAFLHDVEGLTGPGLQLLALTLMVQVAMMVTPLFMQVAIDSVIPTNDVGLLNILLLGFGILYLVGPLLDWLRTRLLIYVGTQFVAQLTRNVVTHLFSLPLIFFERRNIGDLTVRLGATEEIRRIVTQGVITLILDTLFLLFVLVLMLRYSTELTAIACAGAALLAIARIFFLPAIRALGNETLQKQGRQQSVLLESIRGITSIKLGRRELERFALWDNRFSSFMESSARLQALMTSYQLIAGVLGNATTVLLLYFGVRTVLDAEEALSLGAFLAFNAYAAIFLGRISSLFDQLMDLTASRVHLERLADIVLEPPEELPGAGMDFSASRIEIGLRVASYSFTGSDKTVLRDISAQLRTGDRVMIEGPSGSGKTTLLKLLCGLYKPSAGEILLNGTPVSAEQRPYLREKFAAVLQNDFLFHGSIIDNITFFDRFPDWEWATACAQTACIHEEIVGLPMSYETLIGEIGSTLSQGQSQRLLIARGLYQRRAFLVLDEGTAHLNEALERRIMENLCAERVSLLYTSHKPALSAFATQVWQVEPSGVVSVLAASDDVRLAGRTAPLAARFETRR